MSVCELVLKSIRDERNPFLFVPNLIGYGRIVLAIVAFVTMQHCPVTTLLLYFGSAFADAFDGLAARAFNQSTKFGALLDQLTDRCATMCLIMALCVFYPSYLLFFQLSVAIDIASHWMHTQVALMCGRSSHKMIDVSDNAAILRLYYGNRAVLFGMCFANELFYVSLYVAHFFDGPLVFNIVPLFPLFVYLSGPFAVTKTAISVVQLAVACVNAKELDCAERLRIDAAAAAAKEGKSN